MNFSGEFTKVKGISDRRRMPRLGKIRLGVRVRNMGKDPATCECKGAGCFRCTHPSDVPYFVVPPEVQKVYGEKPTSLDVMFPLNDPSAVFPQAYKYYGSGRGLKCMGNGEQARESDEHGNIVPRDCPCERLKTEDNPQGQCMLRASLMVMLPKVSLGGVYQIDTGSYNSIIDLNSSIDYVRGILSQTLGVDRFAWIPLCLERVKRETHYQGHRAIHYTLRFTVQLTIEQVNQIKADNKIIAPPPIALPEPEDVNPSFDEGKIVDQEPMQQEEPARAEEASREPGSDDENELDKAGITSGSDEPAEPPAPKKEKPRSPDDTERREKGWISVAKEKRLWAIAKSYNISEEALRLIVKATGGVDHLYEIHWKKYDAVCKAVEDAGSK